MQRHRRLLGRVGGGIHHRPWRISLCPMKKLEELAGKNFLIMMLKGGIQLKKKTFELLLQLDFVFVKNGMKENEELSILMYAIYS